MGPNLLLHRLWSRGELQARVALPLPRVSEAGKRDWNQGTGDEAAYIAVIYDARLHAPTAFQQHFHSTHLISDK